MVEELTDRLDRLADVSTQLGGGVAKEVDARGRETGQAEVATEAVVEGSAGDSTPAGAGGHTARRTYPMLVRLTGQMPQEFEIGHVTRLSLLVVRSSLMSLAKVMMVSVSSSPPSGCAPRAVLFAGDFEPP